MSILLVSGLYWAYLTLCSPSFWERCLFLKSPTLALTPSSPQVAAFSKFPGLRQFSLSNVASIDGRDQLTRQFGQLSNRQLHEVAAFLALLPDPPPAVEEGKEAPYETELLLEMLVSGEEGRWAVGMEKLYWLGRQKQWILGCLCVD